MIDLKRLAVAIAAVAAGIVAARAGLAADPESVIAAPPLVARRLSLRCKSRPAVAGPSIALYVIPGPSSGPARPLT